MSTTPFPTATILGYPRIGPARELKRAVESYWAGRLGAEQLRQAERELRLSSYGRLVDLGLDAKDASIPDSFSLYDQVLDATSLLGAIPERFAGLAGYELYFAMARGNAEAAPMEMTKWFDTNYHYLVPEIGPDTPIGLSDRSVLERFAEAGEAGYLVRPVLVGPVTWLALAKTADGSPEGFEPLDRLDDVVTAYAQLLDEFSQAGATWVQFDEPALTTDNLPVDRERLIRAAEAAWTRLAGLEGRPRLAVTTPYGDARKALPALAGTGVDALHAEAGQLAGSGADYSKVSLIAGVVDGRNVWAADLAAAADRLRAVQDLAAKGVAVSTTTSLQHVPYDTAVESWPDADLDRELHEWLAFADQKVGEIVTLARGLREGWAAIEPEIERSGRILAERSRSAGVRREDVRERAAGVDDSWRSRADYVEREAAQRQRLNLPLLPTTTIGSFPQTSAIRTTRAALGRGEITPEQYRAAIRKEIAEVVRLQENLGVDVLVHGEPERNDMVQYFAELLDGFAATRNGWVQSYGTRCTRPSILWGDVARSASLTAEWTAYAQSLTDRPVKGMLTGPVTILAWSFVRDDLPIGQVADQVALALRDEIAQLQEQGTAIIQVDEPALRELLPPRADEHGPYLEWAVGAFRLATSVAEPATQIHTHLCYSEFGQIIDAIDALDADVTSIEAARSRMEILPELAEHGYARGVGPGVWDIHSPRVPSVAELEDLLDKAVRSIPATRLWANPDCGLKTRAYPETEATLENLVEATRAVRERL